MVYRLYVEKKPGFDHEARALLEELRTVRFEAAGRFPDALFLNINTPQAYDALLEKGDRYD